MGLTLPDGNKTVSTFGCFPRDIDRKLIYKCFLKIRECISKRVFLDFRDEGTSSCGDEAGNLYVYALYVKMKHVKDTRCMEAVDRHFNWHVVLNIIKMAQDEKRRDKWLERAIARSEKEIK